MKPVKASLDGISSLQCVSYTTQFWVTSKLAEVHSIPLSMLQKPEMLNSDDSNTSPWGIPFNTDLHLDVEPLTAALWLWTFSEFLPLGSCWGRVDYKAAALSTNASSWHYGMQINCSCQETLNTLLFPFTARNVQKLRGAGWTELYHANVCLKHFLNHLWILPKLQRNCNTQNPPEFSSAHWKQAYLL